MYKASLLLLALLLSVLIACGSDSSDGSIGQDDVERNDRYVHRERVVPDGSGPDYSFGLYGMTIRRMNDEVRAKLAEYKDKPKPIVIPEDVEPGVFEEVCATGWIKAVVLDRPAAVQSLEPLKQLDQLVSLEITSLPAAYAEPIDLQMFNRWPGLSTLRIVDSPVKSLPALSKNTNLKKLTLNGCGVNSLAFIRNLVRLTHLEIKGPGVTIQDYSPLSNLKFIRHLNFQYHPNLDNRALRTLANASNLRDIDISYCTEVTNLDFMKNPHKNFADIIAAGCTKLNDISALAKVVNPGTVDFSGTSVRDISPLYDKSIDHLYLSDTPFNDFASLSKIRNLQYLRLNGTAIQDLSELDDVASLKQISIERTPVRDLSLLSKHENLVQVFVSDTVPASQRQALEDQRQKAGLVTVDYHKIQDQIKSEEFEAKKKQLQKVSKHSTMPVILQVASETNRQRNRIDAEWERDHEQDLMAVGALLKDPKKFADQQANEEAAVHAILDQVVLLEWQMLGPMRNHPTYGPKGGDLRSDFRFPRTNPASQYVHGRQLVTRGNQDEQLAGAKLVIRSADTGFSPAQAFAAELLSRKDGPLDYDLARAFEYAQSAADQNNFAGHYRLTELYGKKETPAQQKPAAVKHAEYLAENDVPVGHLLLGVYHEQGLLGIVQDHSKARVHYQKAAGANEPLAFYRLAALYANGQGGNKDIARARAYAKIAVAHGLLGAKPWVTELDKQLTAAEVKENDAIVAAMQKELGKTNLDALSKKWQRQNSSLWKSYTRAEKASKIKPSQRE